MRLSFLPLARRIAKKAVLVAGREGGARELGENPLGQLTIRADKDLEELVAGELRRAKIPCMLVTEEAGLIEISREPEWKFVLDPLDGSENYKRGIPIYCMGLCCAPAKGRFRDVAESYVFDLARGDEFYSRKGAGVYRNGKRARPGRAERMSEAIVSLDFNMEWTRGKISPAAKLALLGCADHRRFGPDLLDMCYTACGGVDAFVDARASLSAIHASGVALLREDCVLTNEKGEPPDFALEVDARTGVVAAGTKKLHSELLAALRK